MRGCKRLLFLSNGHGEDVAAAAVINQLSLIRRDLFIKAVPVVGTGTAYREAGAEIVGPPADLPSGGFMRLGVRNLLLDLKGGLIGLTLKQIRELKKIAGETDLVVACGDVVPLLLASLFVRKPVFFIATAKSEYINGHYLIEKFLMKYLARRVFTRDEATAADLRRFGVRARFDGNPVMDAVKISGETFGMPEGSEAIGFLPGSRIDAYMHMDFFLSVVESLESMKTGNLSYLFSFYEGLDLDRLKAVIEKSGWKIRPGKDSVWRVLRRGRMEVILARGKFGDIIKKSSLVIGLAGTGNEQAAGFGRPVVAFKSAARQYNARFLKSQKKLLGENLAVVQAEPAVVAGEALGILKDRARYGRMSRCGIARMGSKGGAEIIAREISAFLL